MTTILAPYDWADPILPYDILKIIAKFLRGIDRICFSRTNRLFHKVVCDLIVKIETYEDSVRTMQEDDLVGMASSSNYRPSVAWYHDILHSERSYNISYGGARILQPMKFRHSVFNTSLIIGDCGREVWDIFATSAVFLGAEAYRRWRDSRPSTSVNTRWTHEPRPSMADGIETPGGSSGDWEVLEAIKYIRWVEEIGVRIYRSIPYLHRTQSTLVDLARFIFEVIAPISPPSKRLYIENITYLSARVKNLEAYEVYYKYKGIHTDSPFYYACARGTLTREEIPGLFDTLPGCYCAFCPDETVIKRYARYSVDVIHAQVDGLPPPKFVNIEQDIHSVSYRACCHYHMGVTIAGMYGHHHIAILLLKYASACESNDIRHCHYKKTDLWCDTDNRELAVAITRHTGHGLRGNNNMSLATIKAWILDKLNTSYGPFSLQTLSLRELIEGVNIECGVARLIWLSTIPETADEAWEILSAYDHDIFQEMMVDVERACLTERVGLYVIRNLKCDDHTGLIKGLLVAAEHNHGQLVAAIENRLNIGRRTLINIMEPSQIRRAILLKLIDPNIAGIRKSIKHRAMVCNDYDLRVFAGE